ncbi:MAG: hypothetical protein HYZ31_12995 [Gammaproteobacteria bacterium]|jgi:hypothetical protein|nr:hypothetical protein [Gammaproteobacteria bacterium]
MIINNRNARIALIILIFGAIIMLYMTGHDRLSPATQEIVAADISRQTENNTLQSSQSESAKIAFPALSLEGTLLADSKTASALIRVNNEPARWFYQGTEILPGIAIIKVDNDQMLLKQNMAYYEIILNDNNGGGLYEQAGQVNNHDSVEAKYIDIKNGQSTVLSSESVNGTMNSGDAIVLLDAR